MVMISSVCSYTINITKHEGEKRGKRKKKKKKREGEGREGREEVHTKAHSLMGC